nr:unnamed protein product [Callosobruchus analis]
MKPVTQINTVTHKKLSILKASLSHNDTLTPAQHGFRKTKSTQSAVARFISKLCPNLDRGRKCSGLFMDVSKAFDIVSDSLLQILVKPRSELREAASVNCFKNKVKEMLFKECFYTVDEFYPGCVPTTWSSIKYDPPKLAHRVTLSINPVQCKPLEFFVCLQKPITVCSPFEGKRVRNATIINNNRPKTFPSKFQPNWSFRDNKIISYLFSCVPTPRNLGNNSKEYAPEANGAHEGKGRNGNRSLLLIAPTEIAQASSMLSDITKQHDICHKPPQSPQGQQRTRNYI